MIHWIMPREGAGTLTIHRLKACEEGLSTHARGPRRPYQPARTPTVNGVKAATTG